MLTLVSCPTAVPFWLMKLIAYAASNCERPSVFPVPSAPAVPQLYVMLLLLAPSVHVMATGAERPALTLRSEPSPLKLSVPLASRPLGNVGETSEAFSAYTSTAQVLVAVLMNDTFMSWPLPSESNTRTS